MNRAVVCMSMLFLSAGAGLVRAGSAAAELLPPHHVGAELGTPESTALTSLSASAEMRGNPRQALVLADQALAADPRNPWAYYNRAAALSRLGQIDEALQSFRAAEQMFSPADRWARSLALYGRAHALDEAGRCPEARIAYAEYAGFVQKDDPRAADMARRYASTCKAPQATAPTPPAPPVAVTSPPVVSLPAPAAPVEPPAPPPPAPNPPILPTPSLSGLGPPTAPAP